MERATQLLLDIAGGRAGPTVVTEVKDQLPARSSILLDPARVERILGIDIPRHEIENLLRRLGMQVAVAGERLSVIPPSHRFDISIPEDLVEEVARLHGYDAIPATPATMPQLPAAASEGSVRRERAMSLLADHPCVQFNFLRPNLGTCAVEMH